MLNIQSTFSGFSVNDIDKAKEFYVDMLGLKLISDEMGLELESPSNDSIFIYQKEDHSPATFTVLNFVVEEIDKSIDELVNQGVNFEFYDHLPAPQDDKGVLRGLAAKQGPDIAWFKDPAGNILSLIQEK